MADGDGEAWEPKTREDWVNLFKDANLAGQEHAWNEATKLSEIETEKGRASDDRPPAGRGGFSLLGGSKRPAND